MFSWDSAHAGKMTFPSYLCDSFQVPFKPYLLQQGQSPILGEVGDQSSDVSTYLHISTYYALFELLFHVCISSIISCVYTFLHNFCQFSCSVVSDSLRPLPQHARLPCPSPTPRVYSNSCPLSWWCHLTISSTVIPFFSCLLSFPASGSFPMSQFFTSCDQSIGVSASSSVLSKNIQDWFP